MIKIGIINFFNGLFVTVTDKDLTLEITWAISNLNFDKKVVYEDILTNTTIIQNLIKNSKDINSKVF